MGSVKSAMFVGGSEELPRFGNIRQKMGDWTEQRSSAEGEVTTYDDFRFKGIQVQVNNENVAEK